MTTNTALKTLGSDALRRFQSLQSDAVNAVTERFYSTKRPEYARFGQRGRDACREDLAFHLEFLRPVLEFGFLAPMVEYLCWLASVLEARAIPADHLALSLDWFAEFYSTHMEASEGALVAAALSAARAKFLTASEAPFTPAKQPKLPPLAATFEAALLAGDQREASAVVNSMFDSGHRLVDIEMDVIEPAMYQIGRKWQDNLVTVAQEHIATAIVQSVMTIGLLRSTPPIAIDKRVLLACVAGNHHTIGLRMVADSFQLAGWEVQYLGSDVPTSSLVQQIGEWSPDLVGLSLSFVQQLKVAKDVIGRLNERYGPPRPPVIIGGLAVNRVDRLGDVIGADGSCIDARSSIRTAAQLVNS